ncbi:hypothetical protein KIN20_020548 [Parelaphostrongylus tenuis]|uniref:Uncharacterized protein n=2 Tax=Parelaphostrongylus tenuis TaxID=148309 RepID=A0AAD5QVM1_PARTN|nr:hypothetical protein KIN20_020548 [Parelaphostrongylus tenuis]
MAKHLGYPYMISLLATISTVLGCGVMPAGQARTRTFNVSGFSLPVAMAYVTNTGESARVPGFGANREGAQSFVRRLVMQTVFDVLESQARSAFLPDPVISTILGQLTVNISYEPLQCQAVALALKEKVNMAAGAISQRCIVVGNTVTGVCTANMPGGEKECGSNMVQLTAVPATHTSITGTLSTTNIIMANWSRAMWQNVMNRALRMLATGPFRSQFFSASGNVDGN